MKITIFNEKKNKSNINIKNFIKKIIKSNIEINIKITKKINIKNLNRKYKYKNKETDILTFINKINKSLSIDIVLCPEIIKKLHNNNWKKIIAHGILHVLKYKHKKIKENYIVEAMEKNIGMSGIEPPTITTSK